MKGIDRRKEALEDTRPVIRVATLDEMPMMEMPGAASSRYSPTHLSPSSLFRRLLCILLYLSANHRARCTMRWA